MRRRRQLFWKDDAGQALVEFSLVAVMFLLLLLSIVEMGRMVLVYTTLANSARIGARYAIVHGGERTGTGFDGPSGPGNTTQIQTVVQNYASAGLIDTSKLGITVNYPTGLNTAGSPVSVTVSYTYDPMISYFSSLLNANLGSTSEGIITF